ncbi:MAG: S66 peptidase family protein [Actinomycetota bacterium]
MLELTRPPAPEPGSTIAIVSPSAPGVASWPHRVEAGTRYLEQLGHQVRLMPNASLSTGWTAGTGEERAADIHAAVSDLDVSVVLAAIGGNHSAQLLPYLDYDLIGSHPKIFQGYSDITVLLWAFAKHAQLQTFHGPALIPEMGEHPKMLPYTDEWMKSAWSGQAMQFQSASGWTDEFLDWDEKRDLERPRELQPATGWHCIRPGTAEGPLLGGCLETISWHIRGTEEWISPEGTIFFLETSEEAPSPALVDAYLTTFERLGVFEAASGLIIGRPYGYGEAEKASFFEVIARRTAASGIPVLADVDLGHTDPMLTLPLGAPTRLDAGKKSLLVS